jgi:hypothetical protein
MGGAHMKNIKVFLDDERPVPPGWIHARWPEDVIELLKNGDVDEISLDHDLADTLMEGQGYCPSVKERTGYDVLLWIEEQVILHNFIPPKISIHTSNPSARQKMEAAKESIERLIVNK